MPNDLTADAEPLERNLRRHLVAGPDAPTEARRLVEDHADGMAEEMVERAILAVSELVTNAVIHGSAPGAAVTLSVSIVGTDLTIEVIDTGSAPPGSDSGRGGYGLNIVRQLADTLHLERVGRWRVVAEFTPRRLGPAAAAEST